MKRLLALFSALLLLSVVATAQTRTVTVISEKANLRGTPSVNGEVVQEVSRDEVFELVTSKGPWFLVQTPRFVGWVHGNTIKLTPASPIIGESPPKSTATRPQKSSGSSSSGSDTYINTYGEAVPRPRYSDTVPAGASARCRDGTYSFSRNRRGTCSHHGGVAQWL
jgi:hypothetical protein